MHAIFICSLTLGAYLIPRIDAAPDIDSIFEIYQGGGADRCDTFSSGRLKAQFPNMQQATANAKNQFVDALTLTDPYTEPLLGLLYNAGSNENNRQPLGESRETILQDLSYSNAYLTTAKLNNPINVMTAKRQAGENDYKPLVLCSSAGLELMSYNDPIPWSDDTRETIAELYGSIRPESYWYIYVAAVKGIARVSIEDLPSLQEDNPFGTGPFPERFGTKAQQQYESKFDFCPYRRGADNEYTLTKETWTFLVDQLSDDESGTLNYIKPVIVFCRSYFTAGQLFQPGSLLPNRIDTYNQQPGITTLDNMKPAWLEWFSEVAIIARSLRTPSAPLTPAVTEIYPVLGHEQVPEDARKAQFTRIEGDTAISAIECIHLAAWQRASPESNTVNKYWTPSLFNPSSLAWFITAVFLQTEAEEPRSWATGKAGHLLPRGRSGPTLPPPPPPGPGRGPWGGGCDGGDDGCNDGGGYGGSASAGSKRPYVGQGSSNAGGKRPRFGARNHG